MKWWYIPLLLLACAGIGIANEATLLISGDVPDTDEYNRLIIDASSVCDDSISILELAQDNNAAPSGGYYTLVANIGMTDFYGFRFFWNQTIDEIEIANANIIACATPPIITMKLNNVPVLNFTINGTRSNLTTAGLPFNITKYDFVTFYGESYSCGTAPTDVKIRAKVRNRCYP